MVVDDVLAMFVIDLAAFFTKKADFKVLTLEVQQAAEDLERQVVGLLVEVGPLICAEARLLDNLTFDRLDVTCDRHERHAIGDEDVLEVLFQAVQCAARGTSGLVSLSLGVCHDSHLLKRFGVHRKM